MFIAFGCQTLFDYQLRYLELDYRILADVFKEFRNLTRKEDGFDGAHFITISQLTYASALKKCGMQIELIKEAEMYRDVEACKRGGYAFVNKHYCKASNPYVNPGAAHSKDDIYLGISTQTIYMVTRSDTHFQSETLDILMSARLVILTGTPFFWMVLFVIL